MTAVTELAVSSARRREQTRARYPDDEGFVERDGVRLFYEVYGHGEPDDPAAPDVVDRPLAPLEDADPLPGAPLPRGHLRRARQRALGPAEGRPTAYLVPRVRRRRAGGDGRARAPSARSLVALSARRALGDPARRRASGARARRRLHRARLRRSPPGHPERQVTDRFDERLDTDEGWAKYNRHYWLRDYEGFLEFFFAQMFNEPHSTKQIEDCVGWGLDTTPETLADTTAGARRQRPGRLPRALRARALPGARDPRQPRPRSARTRRAPRWRR